MKKRFIAIVLCVTMLFALPISANAQAPQTTAIKLIPATDSINPGDTITYSISLGPVAELGSIQMQLDIPSGLTYVAGSFSFVSGIKNTLGFDYLYWTESNLLINGVASANDYQSSSDTTIASFKCKANSNFNGTVQMGLKNLEFASCVTNNLITSRFTVQSGAVTVNKPKQKVYFPDVDYNSWYGNSVDYAVNAGLMTGYSNGYFGTSDGIQRQDFVIILSRLSGDDMSVYAGKRSFKDVDPKAYYAPALAWAKDKGVSNGYTDGSFGVGRKVTREQIMTFLCNYAKLMNFYQDVQNPAAIKSMFSDFGSVSAYAVDSAVWAIDKGVISGKIVGGKKYISPTANAQRCEVATMFYNIHNNGVFG